MAGEKTFSVIPENPERLFERPCQQEKTGISLCSPEELRLLQVVQR
jgi:hypothetical protein